MAQGRFQVGSTSPCNQHHTGIDIPPNLPLCCNEGGAAAGLESPGPGNPHLFVVFSPKTETQLRNNM